MIDNPYATPVKPGKPKKSTAKGTPSITDPIEPRDESVGEANIKISEWIISVCMFFGITFYKFEKEALYKAVGPFVRKFK
jgi:hypothetical protein